MLDCTAGHSEIYGIFRSKFLHKCVNNSTYKRITTANTIQNIKCQFSALISLSLIPQVCFQTVFTTAWRISYMSGNTFQIRISFNKCIEDYLLLF